MYQFFGDVPACQHSNFAICIRNNGPGSKNQQLSERSIAFLVQRSTGVHALVWVRLLLCFSRIRQSYTGEQFHLARSVGAEYTRFSDLTTRYRGSPNATLIRVFIHAHLLSFSWFEKR